jgi:ankyrin repeat protein
MAAPELQAAACGDDALRIEGASREQLAEWAVAAAGGGFVRLLQRLLAQGAPVDVVTRGGATAVMAAAQNGQLAALRLVLAAPGGEAAVNQQAKNGETALGLAALCGRTAEARLLLEHGADPNLCDNDGNSPLIKAAMAPGDAGLGAAALLLDAKADVDHQAENGATALIFACQCSNVEVAELLLERGVNKDLKDNECPEDEHGLDYWVNAAVRKEELLALLARY